MSVKINRIRGSVLAPIAAATLVFASMASGCAKDETTNANECGQEKVSGLEEIARTGRFLMKVSPAGPGGAGRAGISSMVTAMSKSDTVIEPVTDTIYSVKSANADEAADIAAGLEDNPDVEYVEPDHILRGLATFNDPSAAKQWAHDTIESFKAWDIGTGSKDIVVGVIDSGIDYTHPDLKANMWKNPGEIDGNGKDDDGNGYVDDIYGWDFHNDDKFPMADDSKSYHGTHVAGTIGAVGGNGIGVVGHSPNVRLMALKFLGSNGSGYTSSAIKAIDYAIKKGVKVLNNSWGGSSYSSSLYDAIGRAKDAGILFVAAAGNSGGDYAIYPGGYNWSNILVVAASTSTDKLASFSNRNSSTVDVAAPGYNIYSTRNGSAYAYLSGTSMATPLVSGVAAMMYGLRPSATVAQVMSAIMDTVDKNSSLTGLVKSGGRINAFKAMKAMQALPGGGGGGEPPPGSGGGDPSPGNGNTDPLPQPGTGCDLV